MNNSKELFKNSDSSITDFIDNFRQIIKSSSSDIILKLFNNPKMIKLIVSSNLFFKNEDLFFDKLGVDNSIRCFNLMYNFDSGYIKQHIINIFNYFDSSYFYKNYLVFIISHGIDISDIIDLLDANDIPVERNCFARELLKSTHDINYILYNMNYFLFNNQKILSFKKMLISYDASLKYNEELNNYMDDNPNLIINEIAQFDRSINLDIIAKEKYTNFLKRVVDELLKNENVSYHDIEYIDSGFYSNAYKIGDKVLKIGSERVKFSMPNNRRFLRPIYRYNVRSLDDKKVLFCIEIIEFTDTNNITEDDVYEVYKELRDQGLIWTDCKRSNLGRLIKDNKIYFDGITCVSKNSTGYLDENNEILKKGELVIIDNDFIFNEEDFFEIYDAYSSVTFEVFKKYENRYNQEKIKKKVY